MNKSKAVYLNNEWCEIIDCISCPHYDLEHDEDFPEKACMLVYYLHNIGKHLGLTTCPLPQWDDVRMHLGDEMPTDEHGKKPGRDVLIMFSNSTPEYSGKLFFSVGRCNDMGWRFDDDEDDECIQKGITIVGWWELPKDDIKGLYASQ